MILSFNANLLCTFVISVKGNDSVVYGIIKKNSMTAFDVSEIFNDHVY